MAARRAGLRAASASSLEKLDRALMFLGLLTRAERAEVAALTRFRVYFARVQPVLT
jgi:hypothetical protein